MRPVDLFLIALFLILIPVAWLDTADAHEPCGGIRCERVLDRLSNCQGFRYCLTLEKIAEATCTTPKGNNDEVR